MITDKDMEPILEYHYDDIAKKYNLLKYDMNSNEPLVDESDYVNYGIYIYEDNWYDDHGHILDIVFDLNNLDIVETLEYKWDIDDDMDYGNSHSYYNYVLFKTVEGNYHILCKIDTNLEGISDFNNAGGFEYENMSHDYKYFWEVEFMPTSRRYQRPTNEDILRFWEDIRNWIITDQHPTFF